MKRLMEIHSCYECNYLIIKDNIYTHHYICKARNLRSLDIHAHTTINELGAWFDNCTVLVKVEEE